MIDKRFGIEALNKQITNKTKGEKLLIINDALETYWDNQKQLGQQIWQVYQVDFETQALELKEQIENDSSIAYERDWNWYYNTDNIPNNEIVIATRNFIETKRKEEFDSLYFFNLLCKQKDELKDSLDKPISYIDHLKALPLHETQKHILLGMLLYWHGGFPVNNFNKKFDTILKLVEREFLAMFPEIVTPEKQFCSGDKEFAVQLRELENKLNNNVQVLISKGKIHNIEFDFGGLPLYVTNELSSRFFEESTMTGTENFKRWIAELKGFLFTIPEGIRFQALEKGIAYGEMRFDFYLKHECKDRAVSPLAQSWERRSALAKNLFNELQPQQHIELKKGTTDSLFCLDEKVLSKIDFIRLFNTLYELKAFKKDNGLYPDKKEVIEAFGKFIGKDLKNFHPDLNKAYEKSEDANIKIFETLKEKAIQLWSERNYR